MLNGLDLFSGIGGITLALSQWIKPIAYCESDRFCHAVLLSRMRQRELPHAPIWDDITSLRSTMLPRHGGIDIIYGGFPCQDISAAGAGAGLAGERSGLYFEIERLVRETKPTFVFLENVPAIRTRGLGRVVWGFSELGYDCRWTIVSAQEVGAPHLRKRWFLLAHSRGEILRNESGRSRRAARESKSLTRNDGSQKSVEDTLREGRNFSGPERSEKEIGAGACREFTRSSWWAAEPNVGRVANGIPARVDRLRGLGNAVVPLQAREAFKRLIGLKE